MKGKGRLAVMMLAISLSLVCVFVPGVASKAAKDETLQPVLEDTAREYSKPEKNKYILKEHNNCISVFYGEEKVKDTGIELYGLRAHDREILSDGIMVNTYGEVLSLLEDFES